MGKNDVEIVHTDVDGIGRAGGFWKVTVNDWDGLYPGPLVAYWFVTEEIARRFAIRFAECGVALIALESACDLVIKDRNKDD